MAKNRLALEEQADKNRQRLAQAAIEETAVDVSGNSDAEEGRSFTSKCQSRPIE